jgi:hypothetical protein
VSTREAHGGYIRRTIKPVLGQVKIRKLGADSLDALYAAQSVPLGAGSTKPNSPSGSTVVRTSTPCSFARAVSRV